MLASLFSPLTCEVDGFEAVLILGLLLWDLGIVVSHGLRKELEEEFLLFSTCMIQPCDRGAGWTLVQQHVGLLSAPGQLSLQQSSWDVFCSCHLSIVEGCVSRAPRLLKNNLVSFRDMPVWLGSTLLSISRTAGVVGCPSPIFSVTAPDAFSFTETWAMV